MKGIEINITKQGTVNVYSQLLDDEPIYNEVTLDTALRNQLRYNLIKLHNE